MFCEGGWGFVLLDDIVNPAVHAWNFETQVSTWGGHEPQVKSNIDWPGYGKIWV